jgi:hypothetical protein
VFSVFSEIIKRERPEFTGLVARRTVCTNLFDRGRVVTLSAGAEPDTEHPENIDWRPIREDIEVECTGMYVRDSGAFQRDSPAQCTLLIKPDVKVMQFENYLGGSSLTSTEEVPFVMQLEMTKFQVGLDSLDDGLCKVHCYLAEMLNPQQLDRLTRSSYINSRLTEATTAT